MGRHACDADREQLIGEELLYTTAYAHVILFDNPEVTVIGVRSPYCLRPGWTQRARAKKKTRGWCAYRLTKMLARYMAFGTLRARETADPRLLTRASIAGVPDLDEIDLDESWDYLDRVLPGFRGGTR